jgi:hypothetical protein
MTFRQSDIETVGIADALARDFPALEHIAYPGDDMHHAQAELRLPPTGGLTRREAP